MLASANSKRGAELGQVKGVPLYLEISNYIPCILSGPPHLISMPTGGVTTSGVQIVSLSSQTPPLATDLVFPAG